MSVYYHKKPIVGSSILQLDFGNNVGGVKNVAAPTEVGTLANGAAIVNDVLVLDGVNDYIDFVDILDSTFQGSFSIEVWINPTLTGTSTMGICGKNKNNTNSAERMIFNIYGTAAVSSARLKMLATLETTDGTTGIQNWSNAVLLPEEWQQCVATYDLSTTTWSYYHNGVFDKSYSEAQTYTPNNGEFVVGDWVHPNQGGTSFPFLGEMGNVKIYNRVLTQIEVTQNYEAQKSRYIN